MPELPEVETMMRGIRPFVEGRTIRTLRDCGSRCKPISVFPSLAEVVRGSEGQKVTAVRRVAKRIVLDLASGESLAVEPRMTGLMLLADPPTREHLRLEWRFAGKREYNSLWFWDRRGLGTVRLYSAGMLLEAFGPRKLGPDALLMTESEWKSQLQRTSRPIKVALLDQKLAAGIGNLYASEILHLAQIHPARPADSLPPSVVRKLAAAAQDVLTLAIRHEGSTLGDGTYRNVLNQNGSYQNVHRVYMRQDQPCLTCRTGTIVRVVQAQRSTFFCPKCQKGRVES